MASAHVGRLAPRAILFGESNDGIDDFVLDAWATGFSLVAGFELLRHQFTVPAENRVWCDDGRQF